MGFENHDAEAQFFEEQQSPPKSDSMKLHLCNLGKPLEGVSFAAVSQLIPQLLAQGKAGDA